MESDDITTNSTRRWWHYAAFALPLAFCLSGVAVLGDALLSNGALWLITAPSVVLVVLGLAMERVAPEMQVGRLNLRGSSAAIPIVLASVMLGPQKAALVALIVALAARRTYLTPSVTSHVMSALGRAGTCALMSWIIHVLVPPNPDAADVLPLAALGALMLQVLRMVTTTIIIEFREPGSGRAYVAGMRRVIALDVALPVLAMSIALNFAPDPIPLDINSMFSANPQPAGAGSPVPILLALALFMALSWAILRIVVSERALDLRSRQLRESFSRYVPESLIEQLDREGGVVEMGGEEREITVLFCDIRGFTSWSEQLPPTQVVEELNELLSELTDRVFEAGGSLDKYTGDGLMAFWGAPLDQPDHARRAFLAALTMVEGLCLFNLERADQGKPPFGLGVGLHTGKAVVGNIGHEDRHDYTAIGDTVNLSARLEAATKDVGEQLLISRETWDALPPHLRAMCAERGLITVKGRTAPVLVLTVDEHEAFGVRSGSALPPVADDESAAA